MDAGVRRSVRRFAWPVVCGALCVLIARPAYADPVTGTGVPDPGPPPVASAPLVPAAAAAAPAVPADTGPFATQLFALRTQVAVLGERLTRTNLDLAAAQQATASTYQAWQDAADRATRLQQQADDATAKAYKQATELGPLDGYANDLNQLGQLAPGFGPGGSPISESLVEDAAKAAQLASTAHEAYLSARATEQQLTDQRTGVSTQFAQQSQALADLTARNSAAVTAADTAQQAADARIAGQFNAGSNVKGYAPNPIALAAVRAALGKLGSPYVWGTEGPGTFDCSGLVYWAYRQAGYFGLPRIAADQYHATTPIPTDQLLPGDLLFFNPTSRSDWTSISHVGIYLGDNKMLEAPATGDVVKIAPIWWSAFFGATRVVPASAPAPPPPPVPAPGPTPTPSPTPSTSPSPTPTPAPTPSGSPTPTPTPSSPSPTPSGPSPSPSGSPSPTPTPSRTPTPTPATSPTQKPSATASRSASAGTTTSAGTTGSATPAK